MLSTKHYESTNYGSVNIQIRKQFGLIDIVISEITSHDKLIKRHHLEINQDGEVTEKKSQKLKGKLRGNINADKCV